MENSILVRDLTKRFPGFTLDRVSFQVPKGRIVGFIGENGAGKSTTIRLILNDLKKDGGTVKILGRDHADSAVKSEVGVVFDACNFPEVFTPLGIFVRAPGAFLVLAIVVAVMNGANVMTRANEVVNGCDGCCASCAKSCKDKEERQ